MKHFINPIHYNMHYCAGYQEFLINKSRYGKSYFWNNQFFFMSPIWLMNHKMYKEFFILIFLYLNLTSFFLNLYDFNIELAMPVIAFFYLSIHIGLTFLSHNFYYYHLENKFYKAKYDVIKCEKIAKPYPFIVMLLSFVLFSSFTMLCFNTSYNMSIYIKKFMSI